VGEPGGSDLDTLNAVTRNLTLNSPSAIVSYERIDFSGVELFVLICVLVLPRFVAIFNCVSAV